MREPLSDEDVRRIARATAGEILRRLVGLVAVIALTVVSLAILPALIVACVNSFFPPLGQSANPLTGAFFTFTFVVFVVILLRSWAVLRRG